VKVVKSTEAGGMTGTERSDRRRMAGWQHSVCVMSCSSISGRPLPPPPAGGPDCDCPPRAAASAP